MGYRFSAQFLRKAEGMLSSPHAFFWFNWSSNLETPALATRMGSIFGIGDGDAGGTFQRFPMWRRSWIECSTSLPGIITGPECIGLQHIPYDQHCSKPKHNRYNCYAERQFYCIDTGCVSRISSVSQIALRCIAASRYDELIQNTSRQWAFCQIRQITGCAWAGNAGNVFPDTGG